MRKETERQLIQDALEDSLQGLKENPFLTARLHARLMEETPIRKKKLSWSLILVLVLLILTITALAATFLFDQGWYLNHRFTAYRDHEPEKYNAIMEHLTGAPEQSAADHSLVEVVVQDTSLVPEMNYLSVSLRITLKDPTVSELHSMWDLDADGAYVGEGGSTTTDMDGEDRAMHWLWRHDQGGEPQSPRFGPPEAMMEDASKALLLINCGELSMEGMDEPIMRSMDSFRTVDGAVIAVYECDLTPMEKTRDQISEHPFTFTYRVVTYEEGMDDLLLYTGGEEGKVTFFIPTL